MTESLNGPTGHYDAAKTQHVEASRKRGFLVSKSFYSPFILILFTLNLVSANYHLPLQDALSKLPRPHVLVEDAEFLACYSLESQSLTLNDVLSQCSLIE